MSPTATEFVPRDRHPSVPDIPWKGPKGDLAGQDNSSSAAHHAAGSFNFEAAPYVPKHGAASKKPSEERKGVTVKGGKAAAATTTGVTKQGATKAQVAAATRKAAGGDPIDPPIRPPVVDDRVDHHPVPRPAPVVITPPPQPVITQLATRLPLLDRWCLYFIDKPSDSFEPYLVFEIDSVESFWRTLNNIPTPSMSSPGCSYLLFREHIIPKWEDPNNKQGGAYSLKFKGYETASFALLDDAWLRLCSRCVGECWSKDEYRERVNGVLVKVRDKFTTLQVWTAEDLTHDFRDDVRNGLTECPQRELIFYESHLDARKRAEEYVVKKPKK